MSYVAGTPLDAVWSRVSAGERERVAGDLGELIAALHSVAPPAISGWEPGDWPSFVASRRAVCEAEQRGLGLAASWADQIPGFLDGVVLESGTPVLLHTEIMAQHLLVTDDGGGRWRLSGLIDFEPAMRGAREYEFAAAGVFVTQGNRRLLLRILRGYGYGQRDLGHELSRRLLAWLLLHRYCSLAAYLRTLPAPAHPTLEDLAERWFGT
jgi:hygromycin-B 7''-O-kinase